MAPAQTCSRDSFLGFLLLNRAAGRALLLTACVFLRIAGIHDAERNFPSALPMRERGSLSPGEQAMNSSIMRLAKSTPAVEEGILVAGVTITGVAILQSVVIVLSWLVSGA
jgi:hypothetical protein